MRSSCILLAAAAGLAAAESTLELFETTKGSHLIDMTPDTYNETIAAYENTLVQFYAPWCGKCKTVKREVERAADIAHALGLPLRVARIDAQKYKEFAKDEQGIETLPAFFLYRGFGTQVEEFPFLTTGEAMVAGCDKLLDLGLDLSPAKVLSEYDAMELAEWIFWRGTEDGKILTTLMLYKPTTTAEGGEAAADPAGVALANDLFTRAAKTLMRFSNLRFAVVNRVDVMREFDLPVDAASIVLYTEHDEGRAVWSLPTDLAARIAAGGADAEDAKAAAVSSLMEWVVRRDVPLVTDVYHRTLQGMRKRVQTLAIAYFSEKQLEHPPTLARITAGLQEVAFALERAGVVKRGEFTIGIANGDKYAAWMTHFGLPAGRLPALSIEWTGKKVPTAAPAGDEDEGEEAAAAIAAAAAATGARVPVGLVEGVAASFAAPDFAVTACSGVPAPDSPLSLEDGVVYARASFLPPSADGATTTTTTQEVAVDAATGAATPAAPAVAEDGSLVPDANGLLPGPVWVDVPVEALVETFTRYFAGDLPQTTASGKKAAKQQPAANSE